MMMITAPGCGCLWVIDSVRICRPTLQIEYVNRNGRNQTGNENRLADLSFVGKGNIAYTKISFVNKV